MRNVEMNVKGNILTITVNLGREFGQSSSGKTHIIASTDGAATIEQGIKVGLNVYASQLPKFGAALKSVKA